MDARPNPLISRLYNLVIGRHAPHSNRRRGNAIRWLEWSRPDEEIPMEAVAQLLAVPVIYLVATPFILISAPLREGGVRGGYAAIHRWLSKVWY